MADSLIADIKSKVKQLSEMEVDVDIPGIIGKELQSKANVNAVSVKLPRLSTADPEDWFLMIESIFRRHKITSEITKYDLGAT